MHLKLRIIDRALLVQEGSGLYVMLIESPGFRGGLNS